MLILGVPFLDMVTVSINKIRLGCKPWNADRNHLHHPLSKRINNGVTLGCIILIHILLVSTAVKIATKF